MLAEFQPVHGNTQLETQILLVGDMGGVNQIGIAYRHGPQHVSAEHRALAMTVRSHRLLLGGDFVERHLGSARYASSLGVLLAEVAVKAAGHEAMPVGVDEVAGNVLAQRSCRRARQAEVHGSGTPERNLRPADYRSDLESVTGEESFCGQHVEGVEVVVPLRLAPRAPAGTLETLHEVVAAAEQRFVLRLERALTFTSQVEAPNLLHRPAQTAMQAGDDGFQVVDKRFDVGSEHRRRRHIGIGFRPPLSKYPLHDCGQILRMALHEIAQGAQVERRTSHLAAKRARVASGIVEQERRHSGRQAAGEHVPKVVPFRLRPIRVAYATVQAGDHRRMDVLGDHRLVAQVEGGWVDPAGEQLDRIGEVGAVVRYRDGSR